MIKRVAKFKHFSKCYNYSCGLLFVSFYACAIFLTCQDRQVMEIEYVAINVLIITISKVFSLYLIDLLLENMNLNS